jgi:predicted short-subunit dehydrogenase-like oxidoreductase (DUF2520 family)
MQKLSFIGAGNVATHMAKAFKNKGMLIEYVYSRNLKNAESLANQVGAKAISDINEITSDLIILSLPDSALDSVLKFFTTLKTMLIHTSGTLDINVLKTYATNYGVIYPLQTFSKQKELEFTTIPILYEANNDEIARKLKELSAKISDNVRMITSGKRKYYHLAAVYSCNFVNHLFHISQQICEEQELDFDVLLPLISETIDKIKHIKAVDAQTGPAIRNDIKVMNTHIETMENKEFKEIYKLLSDSIQKMKK